MAVLLVDINITFHLKGHLLSAYLVVQDSGDCRPGKKTTPRVRDSLSHREL